MSASVRTAKANVTTMPGVGSIRSIPPYGTGQMGDPGLFGDIWGGIKGAATGLLTGGPLGAIGGALTGSGLIGRPQSAPPVPALSFPRAGTGFAQPILVADQNRFPQQVPVPGFGGAMERLVPGGSSGMMPAPGQAGPKGYRLNKSGYFLKSGQYIAPGTKWVKIRRRNPLNPKALDRSMSRIVSAKRASKKLSRITVRAPACRK